MLHILSIALSIDPVTLDPLPGVLEPAGIADQAAGREYYSQIMRTLENFGGYRRSDPGSSTVTDERRYYILEYDRRQDIVQSARQLDQLVARDALDPSVPRHRWSHFPVDYAVMLLPRPFRYAAPISLVPAPS